MRRVVEFGKRKFWGFGNVDLDALNLQIHEISKDGWEVVSITPNTWFTGFVVSYTLLIECQMLGSAKTLSIKFEVQQ